MNTRKNSGRVPNLERARGPSAAEVLDRILDRGIVIESRTRVFLAGIDLPMMVDASAVRIASLDAYLRSGPPANSGLLADEWLSEPTAATAHSRRGRRG
jgi:hypothetical protein